MNCFCLFYTQNGWWICCVSVVRGWAAERTSKTGRGLWQWMQLVSESQCWTELQAGPQLPHNKDAQGKAEPSKARQIHTQPYTEKYTHSWTHRQTSTYIQTAMPPENNLLHRNMQFLKTYHEIVLSFTASFLHLISPKRQQCLCAHSIQ